MNKKERMYELIRVHGENLNKIFNTGLDAVVLCKKLKRLENKAHALATDYCNGYINSCEEWEKQSDAVLAKVKKVLGWTSPGFDAVNIFVNGDARGYALKIDDGYIRDNNISIYKDWGGYGILAPDFSNEI